MSPFSLPAAFLFFFLVPILSFSQDTSHADRLLQSISRQTAVNALQNKQLSIYQGLNYDQYFVGLGNDGHPFFHSLKSESILYGDVLYTNVQFVYDSFLDEIVVINPDSNWLVIDKRKVTGFSIAGHRFERQESVVALPNGFYEILFKDKEIAVVAKWTKALRASVWKEKVSFFIITDKGYRITKKKDVLEALSDRVNELQRFMSEQNINFKKDRGESLRRVGEFYSSIKQ